MTLDAQDERVKLDEWDDAYRRVENYLQACGVGPRIVLTQLAVAVIDEARRRAENDPKDRPVVLAMRTLFEEMSQGFGAFSEDEGMTAEQRRARGRLGLVTSDAAPRWATFLAQKTAPEDEEKAAFNRPLQTGPELRLSKLPPAQIEYAFGDNDDESASFTRRIPVGAVALAMSVLGAMGAAWAATH